MTLRLRPEPRLVSRERWPLSVAHPAPRQQSFQRIAASLVAEALFLLGWHTDGMTKMN